MPDTHFPRLIEALKNLSTVPQAVTKLFLKEGVSISSTLAGLDSENFFERFERYLRNVKEFERIKIKEILDKVTEIREEFLMLLLFQSGESLEFYTEYLKNFLVEFDKEIKDFIMTRWVDELIENAEKSMILPCGDTARELFKFFANVEELDSYDQFSHAVFSEEINKNKNAQIIFVLNKTHAFCLLVLPAAEGEERVCYIIQSFIEDYMKMGFSVEEWLLSDKIEKMNLNVFLKEIGLLCDISDEDNVEEKMAIIQRYFYTTSLSEEQKTRMKDLLMHQAFFPEDFTVKSKEEDLEHIAGIIETIVPLNHAKPEFFTRTSEAMPIRFSQNRYANFAQGKRVVQSALSELK